MNLAALIVDRIIAGGNDVDIIEPHHALVISKIEKSFCAASVISTAVDGDCALNQRHNSGSTFYRIIFIVFNRYVAAVQHIKQGPIIVDITRDVDRHFLACTDRHTTGIIIPHLIGRCTIMFLDEFIVDGNSRLQQLTLFRVNRILLRKCRHCPRRQECQHHTECQ